MAPSFTGGCLCGAIRYRVSAPIAELRACHCLDCQKTSGAGGSVNAVVQRKDFIIVQGKPKQYACKAASGRTLLRHFCGDCGSPIYSQRESTPERIVVRAGGLDDSSAMKITANIWTRTARPWSWIDPASQQLPGNPD